MILEGLDSSLSGISPVVTWGYQLVWYVNSFKVRYTNSLEISLSNLILLALTPFFVSTLYDVVNPLSNSLAFRDLKGVAWM